MSLLNIIDIHDALIKQIVERKQTSSNSENKKIFNKRGH